MILNVSRNEMITILQRCCKPPYSNLEELLTKNRIVQIGNNHNEDWIWKKDYLEALSDSNLVEMWKKYK